MQQNKSKLIADSLQMHSRLKRDYRNGKITKDEFGNELVNLLNILADITEMFGDCTEIDYVKEVVWFTIEAYANRKPYSRKRNEH